MVSAKYLLLVPMVVSCALRVDADVVSVVHGPQQGAWHYGGFGDFPPTTFFPEVVAPAAPLLFDSTITGPGANISQAATGVSYNEGDDFGAINTFPGTFLSQSAPAGGNDPATLWIFGEAEYTLDVASDVFVTWDFPVSAVVPPGSVGEYHMNTFIQGSGWVFDESGEVVPDNWAKNYLIDHVFTSSDTVRFSNFEFVDRVKTVGGRLPVVYVSAQITLHARNDGGPVAVTLPEGLSIGNSPITAVPEPNTMATLWSLLATASLAGIAQGRRSRKRSACVVVAGP